MGTPSSDPFLGRQPDLGSPIYSGFFAITPGVALPCPTRALMISSAGALSVVDMYGVTTVIQIPAAVLGFALPMRVAEVNSSGTTASGITGCI